MPGISIHVVDVSRGVVASGMRVELFALSGAPRLIAAGHLSNTGVLADAALNGRFEPGFYEARFHAADYFRAAGVALPAVPFLDVINYRFGIADPGAHYHLPDEVHAVGLSCFAEEHEQISGPHLHGRPGLQSLSGNDRFVRETSDEDENLAGAIALTAAFCPALTAAQDYPTKPVRIVVTFPPGGSSDVTARALSVPLQKALGQPIVVDNKPGAGGTIAATEIFRASPDGYNLLMSNTTPISLGAVHARSRSPTIRSRASPTSAWSRPSRTW
jgi:5-hydroxyisourate hydrolase